MKITIIYLAPINLLSTATPNFTYIALFIYRKDHMAYE